MLSSALPLPSILIVIPCSSRYSVHNGQVNCDPWSELIISGFPYSLIACLSTLREHLAPSDINAPNLI